MIQFEVDPERGVISSAPEQVYRCMVTGQKYDSASHLELGEFFGLDEAAAQALYIAHGANDKMSPEGTIDYAFKMRSDMSPKMFLRQIERAIPAYETAREAMLMLNSGLPEEKRRQILDFSSLIKQRELHSANSASIDAMKYKNREAMVTHPMPDPSYS